MNFFEVVGATTVGMILLALILALLTLAKWATGFILGAFRRREVGILKKETPWWALVLIGLQWLWQALQDGGGEYQVVNGKRYYRYAFHRQTDDDAD